MAEPSFGIIALLFALLSGGANDLLDFVSSDGYWRAKGVTVSVEAMTAELKVEAAADLSQLVPKLGNGDYADREQAARQIRAVGPAALPALERAAEDADPEVSSRARALSEQIRRAAKASDVRRMMAIRTLGEMKNRAALPTLNALRESKDFFVADYAARAIAMIEGKPLPPRTASVEALEADLALLPANCGVVGRVPFGRGSPPAIEQLGRSAPLLPGEDRRKTLDAMTAAVIGVAEQVGNVRLEAVTFGVSDAIGDRDGFAIAIVRGRYDAKAVRALLRPVFAKTLLVDGAEVLTTDKSNAVALASDERLIAFGGPSHDKMPIGATLAAARDHKAPLLTNVELVRLIGTIDPKADAWVACRVSAAYRVVPVLGSFETVTVTATHGAEGAKIRALASGNDPARVKAAVDTVNQQLATAQMELPKLAQRVPALAAINDFVQGMRCEANGKDATLTGSLAGDASSLLALPYFILGGSDVRVQPPAAVQGGPAQPGAGPQPNENVEEPKR